ncbi:helix-turn-helix domain-containing protein [Shinella pollutisoli]|uniref:Helix-turn-helix domain-containing protein n=2 Tax=Shinella pollutisoli TaxID=2250594 RepID=A0ABV7DIW9_9HYPH
MTGKPEDSLIAMRTMRMAKILGENVRKTRLKRGMTLEALATEVGLAYSYMGGIERGQKNPTLDVVERIASALDIEPVSLLSRPEE